MASLICSWARGCGTLAVTCSFSLVCVLNLLTPAWGGGTCLTSFFRGDLLLMAIWSCEDDLSALGLTLKGPGETFMFLLIVILVIEPLDGLLWIEV